MNGPNENHNNCKNCGNLRSQGAKFCSKCGFSDSVKICCPKCHKEVGVAAIFCEFCGQSLKSLNPPEQQALLGVSGGAQVVFP